MGYISNIVIDEEYIGDNKHIAKYNNKILDTDELKKLLDYPTVKK